MLVGGCSWNSWTFVALASRRWQRGQGSQGEGPPCSSTTLIKRGEAQGKLASRLLRTGGSGGYLHVLYGHACV